MKGALKLGSIRGIAISIHWTFIFLIAFIIYSDSKAGENKIQILWSLLFVMSIFATVLLHELGHALTAKRFNITTKDITLLPIGGLARLESLPEKPKEELLVAIAGPLVNLAIALVTWFFIDLPDKGALLQLLSHGINANNFFINFFLVNISLAVFNLIPAFPMDGGRVLRAILAIQLKREQATKIAAGIGQLIAILFFIVGFYASPMLIFIGIFIFIAAKAESQQMEMNTLLKDYKVKDIVMHHYQTIETSETINTAVHLLLNGQDKSFLITQNRIPVGTLSRNEIIKALSNKQEHEPVGNLMNTNLVYLDANMPLEKAFETIQKHKTDLLPVLENNSFLGVVDIENILEFIMINEAKG